MNTMETFANQTSLHGFHELYHAKNIFCKTFWALIIIGAFGVTTLQTYQAVTLFFSNPSYTIVSPASNEDMYYPAVQICPPHWMYWVDWNKALKHGFSKEMVLYGLSYLAEIDSLFKFNISETKEKFLQQMKSENISLISHFYRLIVKPFPLLMSRYSKSIVQKAGYQKIFNYTRIYMYSSTLCYITTGGQIRNLRRERYLGNGSEFSFSVMDHDYYSIDYSNFSTKEYAYYLTQYLSEETNYNTKARDKNDEDLKQIGLPFKLFADGGSYYTQLSAKRDWYFCKVGMSAYRIKQLKHKPCAPEIKWISGNKSESEICTALIERKFCKCPMLYSAIKMGYDAPENLCPKRIRFVMNDTILESDQKQQKQMCVKNVSYENELQTCLERIPTPCETWSYTVSLDSSQLDHKINEFMSKNVTDIFVVYPNPSQVLITTEVDAQTWENFVGSIGGVIGIWTGASILSFIQVFSICCHSCEEDKEKSAEKFGSEFKNSNLSIEKL